PRSTPCPYTTLFRSIGSPRASLESNHALRELVGADRFYSGIAAAELENIRLVRDLMQNGPLPVPSMRDIESHDAVFILGEDLTQDRKSTRLNSSHAK